MLWVSCFEHPASLFFCLFHCSVSLRRFFVTAPLSRFSGTFRLLLVNPIINSLICTVPLLSSNFRSLYATFFFFSSIKHVSDSFPCAFVPNLWSRPFPRVRPLQFPLDLFRCLPVPTHLSSLDSSKPWSGRGSSLSLRPIHGNFVLRLLQGSRRSLS